MPQCRVDLNWRDKSLEILEVTIDPIAQTTTSTGPKVCVRLDPSTTRRASR
jgi:hypothetical protein